MDVLLAARGATGDALAELLAYCENVFDPSLAALPAADEAFVAKWERYALTGERVGVFEALAQKLPQLQFAIEAGVSETDAYRAATRRGAAGPGTLRLERPAALRLVLHPSPAGTIPVLTTTHRADFVTLVRAFVRRSEPAPIPDSMGAVMIAGFNNWDRIREHRAAWAARTDDAGDAAWAAEFRRLIPQKERYQDRFILLSDGPYSAVPAAELGLDEMTWRHHSLAIRREHECAHYFTRRMLGAMRTNMHDELIADFMGLVAAQGYFPAAWFLRFAGLEGETYREGGRLQNYRGELGGAAFAILQDLVRDAAHTLERFSRRADVQAAAGPDGQARLLLALARTTLPELAAPEADGHMDRAWEAAHAQVDRGALLAAN